VQVQKITPCLWFDKQAKDAAEYYTSIFPDSKLGEITYYGDAGPMPAGTPMTVMFQLAGQEFMGLNAGPEFPFTEAISFSVVCDDQAEVDRYWDALAAGGKEVQCGWVTDKFGLSWQVVPRMLTEIYSDSDKEKVDRVMSAMMQMVKLDIDTLEKAAAG
jgi:predicted 3-demethylubiquinone-9 3-methyltransferase (glyoxalase superfamily)